MPTAPQMATSSAMATRTSRVRKCHVDGLRQSRPGTRVMPESVGTDQSAGFRT